MYCIVSVMLVEGDEEREKKALLQMKEEQRLFLEKQE